MPLLDIVSCYVSDTINFNSDFSRLRKSFTANGFKEKQLKDDTWKYTRGAGLALEFDYSSETLQMNVFIRKINETLLEVKVGNSGFPFEPLLMKKRFVKNLNKIIKEIEENGELRVSKDDVKNIQKDSNSKKIAAAIFIILAMIVIYYNFFKIS